MTANQTMLVFEMVATILTTFLVFLSVGLVKEEWER